MSTKLIPTNIIMTNTEMDYSTMDYSTHSRILLINKCKELGLTKFVTKTKKELIELILSSTLEVEQLYERDEPYLSAYLSKIRNKDTFKRVCISPLRYAGGKSKAIGLILDNLPKLREKKIISPFFGGGSFELCASQELGIEIVGYDIFGMLVNFWDVLIHHKNEFIVELKRFNIIFYRQYIITII